MMKEVLGRDVSDRITITANNGAGLGVSTDFYIENMRHRVDASLKHEAIMTCSEAAKSTDAWVLGDAVLGILGTTTRLGY